MSRGIGDTRKSQPTLHSRDMKLTDFLKEGKGEGAKAGPIPDFFDGSGKESVNMLAGESEAPAGRIYVGADGVLVKDRTYKSDGAIITVFINPVDRRDLSEGLLEKGFFLNKDGRICAKEDGLVVDNKTAEQVLGELLGKSDSEPEL